MSWRASARHGVREAPAGLALVQDLLNTRATMSYGPDLLVLPDDAQRWLSEALTTWSRTSGLPAPVLLLTSTDMRSLRDDAVAKIREGLTTVEEVLRVIRIDATV